jgi:hypothetical protein
MDDTISDTVTHNRSESILSEFKLLNSFKCLKLAEEFTESFSVCNSVVL